MAAAEKTRLRRDGRSTAAAVAIAAALAGAMVLEPTPAAAQGQLFVTTTNYEFSGNSALVDLESPYSAQKDILPIHGDTVARCFGRWVFIVNRLFRDSIIVLDAADDFRLVTEYSTGPQSNPQDIVVVDASKAYVSLYEEDHLLVINPLTGSLLGNVDLSVFNDVDGLPEAESMLLHDGRLFVALQRWDRSFNPWTPGSSALAVIDVATDTLVDADPVLPGVDPVWLSLSNPNDELRYCPALDRIVVNCSGNWLLSDGGLELIDPSALQSAGVLVTESTLGGDVGGFALAEDALYVLASDASFNTCLWRVALPSGAALGTVRCTPGFQLADVEVAQGRGYLADRSPGIAGVWIFDAATGTMLTPTASCTGLPPFDMVPVETTATAVSPNLRRGPALTAAPNPFNPRVTLSLTGIAPGSKAPGVEIHDLRGRRVARLSGVARREGVTYLWDGLDGSGRAVASGVYRAVAAGGGALSPAISIPLTLVR